MPVVVASSTRSADALISYALEDKPDQQGERYVMASGVGGMLVSVAKQQMRDVRKKWGKDKPGAFVQAYHVIQSFAKDELDPADPDSWMIAQKLGCALAEERFRGRQVLVVTQRDGRTGCVHNHLVANSIETRTGRSLDSSVVTHARLVEAHERVLEKHGFEQRADLKQAFSDATERYERGEPSGLRRAGTTSNSELREFQQHILWETECDIADELGLPRNKQPFSLTVLKGRIELTLVDPSVVDWGSFVEVGQSHGVRIEQRGKKGRGISYAMMRVEPDGMLAEPAPSDRRRCTTLGRAFEMDAVEAAFADHLATGSSPASDDAPGLLLTVKERMTLALAEAVAEADANTRRLIAETASPGTGVKHPEPPETPAALNSDGHAPGTVNLAQLRTTHPLTPPLDTGVTVENTQGDPLVGEREPTGKAAHVIEASGPQLPKTPQQRFPELRTDSDSKTTRTPQDERTFGD